ncbi:MAG: hypothetical protein MJY68_03260 [Bacteroidaceae bacterium]|nr:hypothetical protein [Bacteroidaceae bacterium]
MKKENLRINSSKCLHRLVCCASLLFLTVCLSTNVSARKDKADQSVVKRGEMIMGTVIDVNENPVTEIKVLESTKEDRVMTFATTDANGDFALKVYDPSDSIKIKVKGYKNVALPINQKFYSIKLEPIPAGEEKDD